MTYHASVPKRGHAVNERDRELDGGNVANGKHVPMRGHTPLEDATKQRPYSTTSFRSRSHPGRDH